MTITIGVMLVLFGVWLYLWDHRNQACLPLLIAGLLFIGIGQAMGRDLGQWENQDAATREWFRHLMRPDEPYKTQPCCGEADGYYCDEVHVKDGQTTCTITDDRPDEPLKRPHIDIGTVIDIPDKKLKWDKGNPTGHTIVFLGGSPMYGRHVFCFVQSSGI